MFRATVVRRFEVIAPRFQPQTKAVQQAMRPTNSAQSSETSATVTHNKGGSVEMNNGNVKGRVGMMPGANERVEKVKMQESVLNKNNNEQDAFESILTVGTVSGQGEGQKIFQTAQAEI